MTYDLYSKFDIELHKANYVHYLEVIIDRDGVVHYAVPSHQEYLINECIRKYTCTREELFNLCPPEYYFDCITWLCQMSGCVSVWESSIQFYDINNAQIATLQELQKNGLLHLTKLPNVPMTIDKYTRQLVT